MARLIIYKIELKFPKHAIPTNNVYFIKNLIFDKINLKNQVLTLLFNMNQLLTMRIQ